MIEKAVASALLIRWNTLLLEQGQELAVLREAGVSKSRIRTLYPETGIEAYTAHLTQVLSDPLAFSAVYSRFKADRASLYSSATGWSLWPVAGTTKPFPISVQVTVEAEQVALLEQILVDAHPRLFRWGRSAYEFCANIYAVPLLLEQFSQKDFQRAYHFTLGSAKNARELTAETFLSDTALLLDSAEAVLCAMPLPKQRSGLKKFLTPSRMRLYHRGTEAGSR